MATTISPILNPVQTYPREFSKLRTPRDNNSPLTQWKNQAAYARQINQLTEATKNVWSELNKLKVMGSGISMFPFCIYNMPEMLYPIETQVANNNASSSLWRTFYVRQGCVLTQIVSTGSFVSGCDGIQQADFQMYPINDTSSAVVVAENIPQHWFWIEKLTVPISGSSYTLKNGVTPTSNG